ncbi:5-methylcytosine restriction system specificity protein McrC [Oenococcus kitaharae]|uniref:McrBC 5-methylcytosine restriction system component n=1 Tax=Oenococcus kitaharae DSM 17330 TaxID=1045004 RepID=G9WFQ9_9LACO|nr:hypothetical protein [Oenococcus kitaharae]EHN59432.1 hypothetical protein OKIT_1349 [Oenococcus kitaharae DSM 17330]OEY83304.1 hypothetical protein NT95_03950 [Oenococcus kitaharae]OEY85102.1 hypothetical protein NT96_00390 [Oenococcus kitaharae]OEY85957.1 hypothetical protein NV75_00340 [Oenococcus kitaharae]
MKIKDNTRNPAAAFQAISGIVDRIGDKTLGQLEKEGIFVFPDLIEDAEDITKDEIVLQKIDNCYRSSNVMGFIGLGSERLVIESRFSVGQQDYFFQYLLEKVLDLPNILSLNTAANQENRVFDWFVFLFPYYLKSAMRKGAYKTYIRHEYNNSNVRGVIDIARHVRQNSPFIGRVAYSQREFSYDNDLMELVRHTIEYIKSQPYGNHLLRQVKDQVDLVVSIIGSYGYQNRRKIIIKNEDNPVRHAYFREYRTLQRLCLMILRHEKHQIGLGPEHFHGVLFDGAWLWEEYINTLIGSDFDHPMNKGHKGAQELFSTDIRQQGLIYPDFLSKGTQNVVIADAKYKPVENIQNKDYLQVLAYMLRFDAKHGFYLYPERNTDGTGSLNLTLNSGSTYAHNVKPRNDIEVTKLGLKIPCPTNNGYRYEDFKKDISQAEKEFLGRLIAKSSVASSK